MARNRSWMLVVILTGVVALASAGIASAEEATAWSKLQRGAVNTTTGWLELAVQPVQGAQSDSPFMGVVTGFGEGILLGLQRTGLGLADSLSFPIGPYDRPAMEPETLFGPVK